MGVVSVQKQVARGQSKREEKKRIQGSKGFQTPTMRHETDFTHLVKLLTQACQVPVGLLTFFEGGYLPTKAKLGIKENEVADIEALNAHLLTTRKGIGVVTRADLQADPRCRTRVTKVPFRFYAGIRLLAPSGALLGSLCILDHEARKLSSAQRFALEAVARQVMYLLELRRTNLPDLTAQQQAASAERHEALLKTNQELENFVYRVSHDLRAPISSTLGLMHLIKHETDLDQIRQYIDLAEQSLRKQDFFIRDILDYSKNARLVMQPKPVDFRELYQEALAALHHAPESRRVQAQVQVQVGEDVRFHTDPQRLLIVLHNLISNALRYMNPRQENPYVHLVAEVSAQAAVLRISDNGIGIHPEHLDKVFGMFYRATDHKPGSGLGLYIVKETIEKLGGTIRLASQPNIGTEFTITLPNLLTLADRK